MAVINSKFGLFLFIILLTTLVSCEERLSVGNDLTAAERANLAARAAAECLADSNKDIEDFYENSNSKMFSEFRRNRTWEIDNKLGTTSQSTSNIYVWKVTASAVYFLIKTKDGSSTVYQFLKMTSAANKDMVLNLQKKRCDKLYDFNISSSSMTVNIDVPRTRVDGATLEESETDYRTVSTYPAYFNILNKKRIVRSYDNDGKLKKTDTYDHVFKLVSDVNDNFTQDYTTVSSASFCVVENAAPVASTTFQSYSFPFALKCTTTAATGPDGNGDAVIDFAPATELLQ